MKPLYVMMSRLAMQFITPIPATPIATMAMRELPWSSDTMLIDQDKKDTKKVEGGMTLPKIDDCPCVLA